MEVVVIYFYMPSPALQTTQYHFVHFITAFSPSRRADITDVLQRSTYILSIQYAGVLKALLVGLEVCEALELLK
jgi:hypothetical protein